MVNVYSCLEAEVLALEEAARLDVENHEEPEVVTFESDNKTLFHLLHTKKPL